MEYITAKNNQRVVYTSKLLQKKYREQFCEFSVCGKKLVYEASLRKMSARKIFTTEEFLNKNREYFATVTDIIGKNAEIIVTNDEIMRKISGEEAPEGILCTFGCIDKSEKIDKIYNNTLCHGIKGGIIILDSMRDPGNMGTVIRSAYAFGVGLIVASPDCADIYSPKVQRGAMGASFSQNIMFADTRSTVRQLRENGFDVYAAALHRNSRELCSVPVNEKTAFVIGNEANGLPDDVIELCSGSVIIPISPDSESLNASVAASVIMWEMSKHFR
ncbi:MAG: RNA methyltransferase [Clostridia bacterium]|nr:RNA methyltransferase [Clostridia bacterium]